MKKSKTAYSHPCDNELYGCYECAVYCVKKRQWERVMGVVLHKKKRAGWIAKVYPALFFLLGKLGSEVSKRDLPSGVLGIKPCDRFCVAMRSRWDRQADYWPRCDFLYPHYLKPRLMGTHCQWWATGTPRVPHVTPGKFEFSTFSTPHCLIQPSSRSVLPIQLFRF